MHATHINLVHNNRQWRWCNIKGIPISRSELLPDPYSVVVAAGLSDLQFTSTDLAHASAPDAESTWVLSGALAHRERRRPTVGTSDLEEVLRFYGTVLRAVFRFQISGYFSNMEQTSPNTCC